MIFNDQRVSNDYADAFAFLGNSFLAPMSQTERHGLNPGFWERFPVFGSAKVADAVERCADFAELACETDIDDLIHRLSVEYTRLFVGPPRPAVAPWETFYGPAENAYGFGEPTFAMKRELSNAGLTVSNENNQYADHVGIELLLLSELIRQADGVGDLSEPRRFADGRLTPWIGKFADAVCAEGPNGYYALLAVLATALCESFVG